jgi:hypothetical protein
LASIHPIPFDANPGIEVHAISPSGRGLRVRVAPQPVPQSDERTEADWARQVAANPRLYSGPLLAVVSIDFESGEFYCRRDEFKRLVVQPRVRTGVRILAVCGILTARDGAGREHVLLGRRGERTRIYPGQWETVPAGGVTPPAVTIDLLDESALRTGLAEEMHEELGVVFDVGAPVALVRDHVAFSDDIAFRIDAGDLASAAAKLGAANWEYSQTRWIPVDEVAAFDAAHGSEIIAASRGLFRVLGWTHAF